VGKMKVRLTFTEELLGTASADPEIHAEFIASKGPDAQSREEEVAAVGVEGVIEKSKTIFARDADGDPALWDYQIKGFFKDACGMLTRAAGTKSAALTAYKKIIDGLVFVAPRQIKIVLPKGAKIGTIQRPSRGPLLGLMPDPPQDSLQYPPCTDTSDCQRPLRAQTAKGERVALASSETCPAGSSVEFEVAFLDLGVKEKEGEKKDETKAEKKAEKKEKANLTECVEEWLNYGALRGLGQWRNSGKGRFVWELLQ